MKKPEHNKKELKIFRKHLRNNLTPAEAYLWKELQDKKLEGRKFRRQQSIDNFIVDFYCPEERLIIELDGNGHINPLAEKKDRKRDETLREMGFKVLRFENKIVFENLDLVMREIKVSFKKK